MSNIKTYNKGDVLFKEGDKAQSVFLIQSGSVSVFLPRSKKNIELYQISSGQVIGEQVLTGANQYNSSAIALAETKVIELPAEALKAQVEAAPQIAKLLIKSLGTKLKLMFTDLKSFKLERDPSPCPPNQVPKVFAEIFHIAKHLGQVKDNKHVVNWRSMKQYAERIFLENPKRLENAVMVLAKLKLAELEFGKPEEAEEDEKLAQALPEVLLRINFLDLPRVEQFFEFFQFYYYKSGKADLLRVDEIAYMLLGSMIKLFEKETPDRSGKVSLPYQTVLEGIKNDAGINLNNDHFNLLEKKGIMFARNSRDAGLSLSVLFLEMRQTYDHWQILREIDKWNENGSVDLKEEENLKTQTSAQFCSGCKAEIKEKVNFCANCGIKVAA
jgi:hypothetical protein